MKKLFASLALVLAIGSVALAGHTFLDWPANGDYQSGIGPAQIVAVDVIEHVADFRNFLRTCTDLAPAAILTGPEGGFTAQERALLLAAPAVRRVALGPRILRAETAAVAAISLWMGRYGDWDSPT